MKTKLKQGRRAQAWPPGPAPAGNSQSGARAACVGHTGPSPPCTSLVYVSCVAPSGTRRPSRSWVHTDIRPHSCPFTHSLGTSSVPAPRDSSACHCRQPAGGHTVRSVLQGESTLPGQGRLPGGSGWTEEPEAAAPQGRRARMPTFGSFQVPDADGARLGAGHDELLGGVEADTLHWGRVTCQALWRGGGSFSTLCGQTLSCCLKFWGPRKCVTEKRPKQRGHSQAPARTAEQLLLSASAARAKSEPDPGHAARPPTARCAPDTDVTYGNGPEPLGGEHLTLQS